MGGCQLFLFQGNFWLCDFDKILRGRSVNFCWLEQIVMETSTETRTTPHQPGKSWIVLEEDDGNGLGLPLLMATGRYMWWQMVMAMAMVLGDGNGLGYGHRLVHMLFSRTGCGLYGEICCLGKRWSKSAHLSIFETQLLINYFWEWRKIFWKEISEVLQ